MASLRTLINAQMATIIDDHFGCLDAAAETIFSRTGIPVNKGTLFKRLSGQCGWPADGIAVLEDAAGISPVSNTLYRRLNPTDVTTCRSMRAQVGVICKEAGEPVYATMAAQQSARCEVWAVAAVWILREQTGKTARAKFEAACRGKIAKASGPVVAQALTRA